MHRSYRLMSISGDGKRALANVSNTDPRAISPKRYIELFDTDAGKAVVAGNPALDSYAGVMDGDGSRIVYARSGALYTYCLDECEGTELPDSFRSGYWSAPSSSWIGGQLRQGSKLMLQAEGKHGLTVDAIIDYKRLAEDGGMVDGRKNIRLPERSDEGGLYLDYFVLPEGTVELLSIALQTEDGSDRMMLDQLPVKVAGMLEVEVVMEDGQPELPPNAKFRVTGPSTGLETELVNGISRYSFPLPSGGPYSIELFYASPQIVLARQEGIVMSNGSVVPVQLAPVFAAALKVKLNYSALPSEPAIVLFKQPDDGTEPTAVTASEDGEALWPGVHQAGDRVTVSIVPPPGYKAVEEKTVALRLGNNLLAFDLYEIGDSVTNVTVNYSRTTGSGGDAIPVIGSQAIIEAEALPGLHMKAVVSYLLWKEGPVREETEELIALEEAAPGLYRGMFLIREGIARLEALSLEANGEHLNGRHSIGSNVAGRLRVAFDIPEGEQWRQALNQAALSVFYSNGVYSGYNGNQIMDGSTLDYSFDVPYEGVPYQVTVRPSAWSLQPLQTEATDVEFGRIAEVRLHPEFTMQVKSAVKADNGQKLWIVYTLLDGEGNQLLTGKTSGDMDIRLNAHYGDRYRLRVEPVDPLYMDKEIEFVANELIREVPVILAGKELHEWSGRVLGTDGKPIPAAVVTAVFEGKERIFRATTKADGGYTLVLPEGSALVRATSYGKQGFQSRLTTVEIPGGGSADAELRLLDYAMVDFNLYTKQLGSDWQGPVSMDWRVAYHFGLETSHGIVEYGPPLKVAAVTGDVFRICVNGTQAQLPSECKQVTIGEDNRAALEMHLESSGAQAVVSLVNPDGSDAGNGYLQLAQLKDDEAVYRSFNYSRSGNRYAIELPGIGRYRLTAKGEKGLSATIEFTADSAAPLDLGKLTLLPPGKFGGMPGNLVAVSSSSVVPDSAMTVRIAYHNKGLPLGPAENAFLLLELPYFLEPEQGTLIVDGKAGKFERRSAKLAVPLGEVAANQKGNISLDLQIGDPGLEKEFSLNARLSYTFEGGEIEEELGGALVQVARATLHVPETLVKPRFRASGSAPSGATVTVYDGAGMLGTAKASSEGVWQADVALSDTDAMRHRIRTEAEIGGKRIAGEEALVLYDPNDPGLAEMSMSQGDGRVQTFRPEDGVAVFPFVYVPGQPFVFRLKFHDISRVSDVKVWNGDTSAEAVLLHDEYVAVMADAGNPGPVAVTYHKKADPLTVPSSPSEQELRSTLPQALRGYIVDSIFVPDGIESRTQAGSESAGLTGNDPAVSATIQFNSKLSAEVNITSVSAAGYEPTERDLLLERQSGIPLYGTSVSFSRQDAGGTATVSAYLPDRGARSMVAGGQLFNITVNLLTRGTQAYDLWSAVSGLVNPGVIERINADYEAALALCDPVAAEYYADLAMEIKYDIAFGEIIKNALNIAGTFGLDGAPVYGLLFWAESFWAGKQLDAIVEREIEELEYYLNQYDCRIKPFPTPAKPVAKPKIIIDPSGYVYEGMTGNRISNVTATALEQDEANGAWKPWNAEWYEQQNPLLTDKEGRYAWDVPPGKWKVKFEKEGYETAYSDELDVPPPQIDVNVPMISYAPPEILYIRAYPGGEKIEIRFNRPLKADSVSAGTVTLSDEDGAAVTGEVRAAQSETTAGGDRLATLFEMLPNAPLKDGNVYTVAVSGGLISYAGVPLGADVKEQIRIPAADRIPPDEVSGLIGGMSAGTVSLIWTEPANPDYSAVRIRWKQAGVEEYSGPPIEVKKGQAWTSIEGLSGKGTYDFLVSAVDDSGNESAGARWRWPGAGDRLDLSPPPSVSKFRMAFAGTDRIALTWRDPSVPDLSKLNLTWALAAGGLGTRTVEVGKSVQSATITGLMPSTVYTIAIVAVDDSGNESARAVIVPETASAAGDGDDPPRTNPGDGSNEPNQDNSGVMIGPGGGEVRAAEGTARLGLKSGTLEKETAISIACPADAPLPLHKGYHRISPACIIDGRGATPRLPMQLSMVYDPANLENVDVRRLGIYFRDETSKAGWTYIGGVVNPDLNRIEVPVVSFGEYAILLFERNFADMGAHWSGTEVAVLSSRHLVNGTTGSLFEPNRFITRAKISKLLVEALQQQGALPQPITFAADFADVSPNAWYASYVRLAAGVGLVEGAGGRFRPNDPATREELAVLLTRFARLTGGTIPEQSRPAAFSRFKDKEEVSVWARESFATAAGLGWIRGVTDSMASPKDMATRAQAAVILLRVLESLGQITEKP